jgi:hypothetical protein
MTLRDYDKNLNDFRQTLDDWFETGKISSAEHSRAIKMLEGLRQSERRRKPPRS